MRLIQLIALVLIIIVAPIAPARAVTITERYEAVMSVCAAMKASRTLTVEQDSLCHSLREARANRNTASVIELLAASETAFNPVVQERPAAWSDRIISNSDAPPSSTVFASYLNIVELDSDIHVFDLARLDDMAVYEKLLQFESRPLVALLAPNATQRSPRTRGADPEGGTQGAVPRGRDPGGGTFPLPASRFPLPASASLCLDPPDGWEEYESLVRRFRKIAGLARTQPVILRPGISIDRDDFREWILAEKSKGAGSSRAERDSFHALYVVGANVERIGPYIDTATMLYLQPDFAASELTLTRVLRLFSAVNAASVVLVLPRNIPGLEILKAALDGMKKPITITAVPATSLAIFSSPGRMIVSNDGDMPRRVELAPWIKQNLASSAHLGSSETGSSGGTDNAPRSRAEVTTLYSDLTVETFRSETSFDAPPRAIMFVNIASRDEGN